MSKNWIAWWVLTISINAIGLVSNAENIPALIVILNGLWASGTVICLWCRRTDDNWKDCPTKDDECLIDDSNTL